MKILLTLKANQNDIQNINLYNKQIDLRFPGIFPLFDYDDIELKEITEDKIIIIAELSIYKEGTDYNDIIDKTLTILKDNQLLIYPEDSINIQIIKMEEI